MDGRTYGDPCGVARALDVIGERWALLVVRELLFGPKRFTDLHHGLGGMSQNVLSQRLQDLEQAGVVRKVRLGPPASASVYELTEQGKELEPILILLGRWGRRRPLPEAGELSIDALMLALKTTFDAGAAAGLIVVVDLHVEDDRFRIEANGGVLSIERTVTAQADVTLYAGVAALRDLAFRHQRLDEAVIAGYVRVEGNAKKLQRLLDSFP